jgi:WD40 repeat protein
LNPTFFTTFDQPHFNAIDVPILTCKERTVVTLLARLFNEQYDTEVIQNLSDIAFRHFAKGPSPVLSAIMYGLAFAYCLIPVMMPLFNRPGDVHSLRLLAEPFEKSNLTPPPPKPDLLTPNTSSSLPVTEGDRLLANFLSFHEICRVISEQRGHRDRPMLTAFFHHRHRLWYSQLPSYSFSHKMFEREMASFGLSVDALSTLMATTAQSRQWQLTLTNRFISPFYPHNRFKPTQCFEIPASPDAPVTGVCVNALDSDELAIACGSIRTFHLHDFIPHEPHRMVHSASDTFPRLASFESPFSRLLPFTDTTAPPMTQLFQTRSFFPNWQAPRGERDARATCVAAHPTRPYFVSGDDSGTLSLWAFGKRPREPDSHVQYVDAPVTGVSFNAAGDRLLMTTTSGFIFVTHSTSATLLASIAGSRAAWLNADAQIVVAEPRYAKLTVYDLVAGVAPVAVFDFKKYTEWAALAVSGSQVVSGYDDGSVVLLDIISGQHQELQLHDGAVRAVAYDAAGRFFMTGGQENRVRVVNAKLDADAEEAGGVFSDYDDAAECRGVLALAAAKQTIAACGYSGNVRIWHASSPRSASYSNGD